MNKYLNMELLVNLVYNEINNNELESGLKHQDVCNFIVDSLYTIPNFIRENGTDEEKKMLNKHILNDEITEGSLENYLANISDDTYDIILDYMFISIKDKIKYTYINDNETFKSFMYVMIIKKIEDIYVNHLHFPLVENFLIEQKEFILENINSSITIMLSGRTILSLDHKEKQIIDDTITYGLINILNNHINKIFDM